MSQAIPYPQDRTCPYHPPKAYDPLRAGDAPHQVTLYNGQKAWVVAKHAAARALLIDKRLSADRRRAGFPITAPRLEIGRSTTPSFLTMDGDEHARHRRMFIAEFAVKRVNELRPQIESIAHETLDKVLAKGSPADLIADFAVVVPTTVICGILGVPYRDREFFQAAADVFVRDSSLAEIQRATNDLNEYLTTLAVDPPMDGLIARLASAGELTPAEIAIDCRTLLFAGQETTASTMGLAVIALLEHPQQLAALRAGQNVVEEVLRFVAVLDGGVLRIALEDIEIGGVLIRAGDGVLVSTSLASRDPDVFTDPDTFDVGRTGRNHVAFGYGIHQCIGQNLARVELDVALSALFERIPALRLAVPTAELELRGGAAIQGVHSLPIAW
nr:cytochrome P450 [Kibdelosporangium sp. MJ126-NF4]CEL18100.1 putative cytochrome P450 hydroxylase [Kibdelosporangium sp. MJ126-NF4]CTQ90671.1 putative cytochrome P450 hydroxylase [Kibdelosporangium sp. MJ126-NF4]